MKSESAFRGLRRRKHKDAIIHHTHKAEGHFPTSSQGLILIWNKHSVIFLFFFFFLWRGHCCGWSRDEAVPFDSDMTQLRSHLLALNLRENEMCVLLQVGRSLFKTVVKSTRRKCAAPHVLEGQQILWLSVCPWFVLCLINKMFPQKYGN